MPIPLLMKKGDVVQMMDQWLEKLDTMVLFRQLLDDPVIAKLRTLLSEKTACAYAAFAAALFAHTDNFSDYLLNCVLEDENFYMRGRAAGKQFGLEIEASLKRELDMLSQLAMVQGKELQAELSCQTALPCWQVRKYDFFAVYQKRMREIGKHGYGMFAKYHMFLIRDHQLVPVKHPDDTSLNAFSGYELERQEILQNTRALLDGKPAANVLLYGDAGTGKSATVKALANAFCKDGLRLIELKKSQLHQIPELVDQLSENPLKFILFIDDLSFTANDDNFAALKAILEGSVSAKAQNVVVYATSNRRHLVKETFSDREGDDIHQTDTMEELFSLSDRFGLKVTFMRPDKEQYLKIVRHLADISGIELEQPVLDREAEIFALGRGGRSARAAKQFIDSVLSR